MRPRLQALKLLTPDKPKSTMGDSVKTQKRASYKINSRKESKDGQSSRQQVSGEQTKKSSLLIPTFSQKRLHPNQQKQKKASILSPRKVKILDQEFNNKPKKSFAKQIQDNANAGFFEQSPFNHQQANHPRESTTIQEPVLEFPAPIS